MQSAIYRAASIAASICESYNPAYAHISASLHGTASEVRVQTDPRVVRDLAGSTGAEVACGGWYGAPPRRDVEVVIDGVTVWGAEHEVSDAV